MGCCGSSLRELVHAEKPARPPRSAPQRTSFSLSAQQAAPPPLARGKEEVLALAEFSLAELHAVTDGFAAGNIVSESGKKAPNLVYRGRLKGGGAAPRCSITVKFSKLAWPDPKQFEEEARGWASCGTGGWRTLSATATTVMSGCLSPSSCLIFYMVFLRMRSCKCRMLLPSVVHSKPATLPVPPVQQIPPAQ